MIIHFGKVEVSLTRASSHNSSRKTGLGLVIAPRPIDFRIDTSLYLWKRWFYCDVTRRPWFSRQWGVWKPAPDLRSKEERLEAKFAKEKYTISQELLDYMEKYPKKNHYGLKVVLQRFKDFSVKDREKMEYSFYGWFWDRSFNTKKLWK